jgi:hypothetical protein
MLQKQCRPTVYSRCVKSRVKDLAKILGLVLVFVLLCAFMMARMFVLLRIFK